LRALGIVSVAVFCLALFPAALLAKEKKPNHENRNGLVMDRTKTASSMRLFDH